MSGRHRAPSTARLTAARTWWWPYLVIAVLATLLATTSNARGGYTGSITNTGNSTRTGSLITSAVSGGTTECDLSTSTYNPITTANTAQCSGDLTPALSTGTAATSLGTTITDKGSLSATSASLIAGTCGPIQLANTAAPSDPMLVRGTTLSYAQPGPMTGGTGLGLSGNSGYAADVTSVTPPTTTYSQAIWFKFPAGLTTGGTMMGLTNTPSNVSPGNYDRMIWMDNTGHVVYGIYNGATTAEATTTIKYNDGAWHLAVATVSGTGGISLYVDNATVITNTLGIKAESGSGYWHVGWDNVISSGWTNSPTNQYFTGTLADAAIFPSVLSAAQIAALYTSGTQSAWNTNVAARTPTYSWSLGDDGTTAYTGTVPLVTPAACTFIDATVGATTSSTACAFLPATGSCAAPSASSRLSILAGATKSFGVFPTTTQSMAVTVTLQRDTTNTVAANPYAAGLHITLPLTVACASAGNFSATLVWAGQDMLL